MEDLQQQAIKRIKAGESLFVTGSAGVGKSWVIEQVTDNQTVVCAPSGIAALNVGGITCHRLFGLPLGVATERDYDTVGKRPNTIFSGRAVKRIIIDECFKGDVEVLTATGFTRFEDLVGTETVAQVDSKSSELSFCKPVRFIEKYYKGKMTRLSSTNKINITSTENHQMLVHKPSGKSYKTAAKSLEMVQSNHIKTSGFASAAGELSVLERLCIAYQADGSSKTKTYSSEANVVAATVARYNFKPETSCGSMCFSFKKERKVSRFLKLFCDLNLVDYGVDSRGYRNFLVRNVPSKYITKDFTSSFKLEEFSSEKATSFLEELREWDGSVISRNSFVYSNTNKNSCDFVQAVACLCGSTSYIKRITDNRSKAFSDCFKVTVTLGRDFSTLQNVKKIDEDFQGSVYCVEVPLGNIVIRSGGRTHVVGNCGMLRTDQLVLISRKLQKIKKNKLPFGGLQVVLVGDFYQIEPILRQDEQEYFEYDSKFCFSSKLWTFPTIELTEVKRQTNKRQVLMLNSIRRKDKYFRKALEYIQKECKPYELHEKTFHLCCYNKDADAINEKFYTKIRSEEREFKAAFGPLWGFDRPVAELLKLKVGARVVICQNALEGEYVNGERGTVKAFGRDASGEDTIRVEKDSGDVVSIEMATWEKHGYKRKRRSELPEPSEGDQDEEVIIKEAEASYMQFPLKLGWAVSVHKAQGMSLDDVAIDVGSGCFSHGQGYVALSRIRDLKNLSFVRPMIPEDIIVRQAVKDFYGD